MLSPVLQKNDRKAKTLILIFSIIVFAAVVLLSRIKLEVDLGFDPHLFATANAVINFMVTLLLIAGFIAVKKGNYQLHKKIMMSAMILSVIFLVSYIAHHLFAGETKFGDLDHNGIVTDEEKVNGGSLRTIYYIILATHIPLAGIILPFILFTAYRALIAEWPAHKEAGPHHLAYLVVCCHHRCTGLPDDQSLLLIENNCHEYRREPSANSDSAFCVFLVLLILAIAGSLVYTGTAAIAENVELERIGSVVAVILSVTCLLVGFNLFKRKMMAARNLELPEMRMRKIFLLPV